MSKVHLDFETASVIDLRRSSMYRYATDPTTRWLNAYALHSGTGARTLLRPDWPLPSWLVEHVAAGGTVGAHNAGFERLIWNYVLRRQDASLPEMTIAQTDCTAARARAVCLPGALDTLAKVLELPLHKHAEGAAAMKRLTKPRGLAPVRFWTREDAPKDFALLDEYVQDDVLVEALADQKLPALSERERRLWELDQEINDRGIAYDAEAARRARNVVDVLKARDDLEVQRLTGGAVKSVQSHKALAEWISERIPCDSVSADLLPDLRAGALVEGYEDIVEVLDIRMGGAKASLAKLEALERCGSFDHRLRGAVIYHGAGTGRWSGSGFQPQNIVRFDEERDGDNNKWVFGILSSEQPAAQAAAAFELCFEKPLEVLSRSLRGFLKAADGNLLFGGDFSNIEGRIAAWYPGEEWKLQAFRDYDAGTGPDLYKLAFSKSFSVPVEEVTKERRQLGKVQELALGFQGSVGAFLDMAKVYKIKIDPIVAAVRETVTPETWDWTYETFDKRQARGLDRTPWTALKVIVNAWRRAHPAIVQAWWDLQDAAIEAVAMPGVVFSLLDGRISYLCDAGFLWCRIPSGRVLAYPRPKIVERDTRRPMPGFESLDDDQLNDDNSFLIRRARQVQSWAVKSGRWVPRRLYGGLQFENIVQALARDQLVESMFRVNPEFPVVLTVHDEIVAEQHASASLERFEELMNWTAPYLAGCPLSAKAWTDERYVK